MPKQNCPFLIIPGTILHPSRDGGFLNLVHSNYLGEYKISVEAVSWINSYKEGKKVKDLNLTQGLVNCANAILRSNDLNNMPVILGPVESEKFKVLQDLPKSNEGKIHQKFNIADLVNDKVDHTHKAKNLLLQFATQLEDLQAFSEFGPTIQDMVRAKIAGATEFEAILEHLIEERYLKLESEGFIPGYAVEEEAPFNSKYKFTMNGWKQVQFEKDKENTNKVFIATPFEWPENNDEREDVMTAIKKACEDLGWKADVVSQNHTEYITDKILSEIKSSRFVIAELTYHNRGVYFESGFARGLGKNVFHLVKEGFTENDLKADKDARKMHFDIQQVQYRKWKTPKDVETQLFDWIHSTIGKFKES